MSPPAFDRVITKCLAKDPEARWHTAHDLHDELQWIADAGGQVDTPTAVQSAAQGTGWRRVLPWAVGMLLGSLVTGLAVWSVMRPEVPRLVRFAVAPDDAVPLFISVFQ